MRLGSLVQPTSVEVELGGLEPASTADRVRTRIITLSRYAPRRIVRATIRFSTPTGRAMNVVVAHATVEMSSTRVVAHATGATVGEATERVRATLRRQLLDLRHSRRKHGRAVTDESTSDDLLALVRHVTRMPACASRERAVLELEQLDQEFGLYLDTTTGQDVAVWRTPSGGYRFEPGETAAPLSEEKAVQRLALSGEQSLFFTEERSGRGRIAYRRGIHRYGLVVPTP